jgi:predicted phage replisome organizer
MSTDPKKYYWLKLFDSFFRDPKIKKLKTLAGGDTYIVILLKFMLYTIKNNGIYVFEGIEKTLEKELELVLDEKEEHINVVLMFLQQTGLILEVAENQFQLTQVPTMLGTESTSAERVRKHRATKQKALQCNTTVTRCNIEIEKNKKEMEKWEVISEKMALRQIRKDIEIEKLENLAQEEKEIII